MLDKAQKEYDTFLASQRELTYNFAEMTKEQQDAEMLKYTTLKLAAGQEQTKNSEFIKARDVAFAALETEYQNKRSALQAEWQQRENVLV